MNSQQRILDIAKRLLLGETLVKQSLKEEYNKSDSAIQRDIAYINHAFFDNTSESETLLNRKWLFEEAT